MQITFWLDCPQIRISTYKYDYSIWLWTRRKGQIPNHILSISRTMSDDWFEDEANWNSMGEPNKFWYLLKLRD